MSTFTATQVIAAINNGRYLRQQIRQARVRNSNNAVAALSSVNAAQSEFLAARGSEKTPNDIIKIFNYRAAILRFGRSMAEGARQIRALLHLASKRSTP